MTDATSLPQNEQQELLCTYASLILFDEKMAVSADNITKLIQASGAKVEPYLPMLFSRALGQCNIQDLIMSAGSTNASINSSVPSSGAASGDKVTEEVKEEEKVEEEEEEEDMGFSLFD